MEGILRLKTVFGVNFMGKNFRRGGGGGWAHHERYVY